MDNNILSGEKYLQLFENVSAGFPFVPPDNHPASVDLNKFLITNPSSTYLVRVKGDSMLNAGILSGDIVIVDRSINYKNGDIIIASINGETTIKYYQKIGNQIKLIPANDNYKPIIINQDAEFLGVVVGVIRKI